MKKIIFATGNQDKMREIREILADMDVEVVSMKEAGIHADIVEDGSTFEENAVIKAKTICELTGEITLADDSGLEIDYLNKEPGIYSARYMGENGFGYDPIFYLPEYGCTSAELSGEEKNKISHRGKALRAIKDELK